MGSRRSEYSVPPLLKWSSFGPMPTENSTTVMPFAFARRKCPSSDDDHAEYNDEQNYSCQ